MATAAYLINRSPFVVLQMKTPKELWRGTPPDYQQLRVIGCLAYAHVKQDKLEPRALRCALIGYPSGVKGYKLWCIDAQKIIVSRDVKDHSKQRCYFG